MSIRGEKGLMKTQNELILEYMKEHGGITPAEALNYCGSMRLSARIHDLRALGYDIQMKLVTVNTRNGQKVRVSRYWLNE